MNYDIEKTKRKMLVKYPFFGSVVANVEYKMNMNIKTAATDGEVIYYNSEFLEGLSVEEQTFVFAHEVCHIAFNHILRSDGRDDEIWNYATDAVINAFLKRDGLKMPENAVDIVNAINYDADQLYEMLLEQKKEQSGQQGQQEQSQDSKSQSQNNQGQSQISEKQSGREESSGNGSSTGSNSEEQERNNDSSSESKDLSSQEETQDVGHDTHSMWKDALKKHKEKKQNKDSNEKTQAEKEIEDKQKESEQLGEKAAFDKNLEEKKKEIEKLKRELSHQAAGKTSGNTLRSINDIGYSKPILDWRYVLKEAIKSDEDWSYKNATLENGIIVPNLEEQPFSETEIVLDTSGSISENFLKNFLRECKNIFQQSKVKVGCFDTKFYGFHEIRTEKDIDNMKFLGGGGTNFDAAVNAFSRRVDNKIIFTDGYADMPQKPMDAIWIVFGDEKINPMGGRVIYIDDKQLDRLYSYQEDNLYKGRSR